MHECDSKILIIIESSVMTRQATERQRAITPHLVNGERKRRITIQQQLADTDLPNARDSISSSEWEHSLINGNSSYGDKHIPLQSSKSCLKKFANNFPAVSVQPTVVCHTTNQVSSQTVGLESLIHPIASQQRVNKMCFLL